jgi:putative ABC transport system permease protein
MRVLGARRSMLLRSVVAEFSALGLLAGVLAATGATVGGYLLARQLGLNYRFDPLFWLGGVLLTVLIVGFGGWAATRSVVNHPPRAALS